MTQRESSQIAVHKPINTSEVLSEAEKTDVTHIAADKPIIIMETVKDSEHITEGSQLDVLPVRDIISKSHNITEVCPEIPKINPADPHSTCSQGISQVIFEKVNLEAERGVYNKHLKVKDIQAYLKHILGGK